MTSNARLRRLGLWLGALAVVGLGYTLWVSLTGLAIPCPFHRTTGLWCPGCGATRMCLSLLHWDLPGAWRANPGLFLLLPPVAVLLGQLTLEWVRLGRAMPSPRQNALIWAMVAAAVVYGVARNLPALAFLAPR